MTKELKIGDEVPPFLVKNHSGYDMTDESLIGYPAVIIFLSDVNSKESLHLLKIFQHNIDKFQKLKAKTYVVGPEAYYEYRRLLKNEKFQFTFLSDMTKRTYQSFGLLNNEDLTSATFLINSVGIITWIEKPLEPEKHVGRIFQELKSLVQV